MGTCSEGSLPCNENGIIVMSNKTPHRTCLIPCCVYISVVMGGVGSVYICAGGFNQITPNYMGFYDDDTW